jgi:DNA polymerase-3 subunit gamma/tau
VVHAYLFSGPRGTGKTSTARILAKALNCLDPKDGEPCGHCDSCIDIARGSSLDVHELDAASNNGVDAMRDLVARASLATPGKRKVYIIDEVHMLSTAASNALLKTLEEPPEHVVFVLATTDPQKVLPTIRSRTQHFEFHLLEPAVLEQLLSDVAEDARLELPAEGIESAARRGHGSARDALSVLDQVVASGVVEDDARFLVDLVEAIAEQDAPKALGTVAEATAAGIDATRLATELVEALREQFLTSVARRVVRPDAVMLSSDGRAVLPPARCVRALELIGKAMVDMREAIDPRTTLEVAIVRLSDPEVDDSTSALLDRLERLERRLAGLESGRGPAGSGMGGAAASGGAAGSGSGGPVSSAGAGGVGEGRPALGAFLSAEGGSSGPGDAGPGQPVGPAGAAETARDDPRPEAGSAGSQVGVSLPSRDDLVTAWADSILPALKPRARATYQVGRWLALDDSAAVFALPNAAHVQHATALRDEVAAAIGAHFNSRLRLELVTDPAGQGTTVAEGGPASSPLSSSSTPGSGRRSGAAQGALPDDEPEVDVAETMDGGGGAEGLVNGPQDTASWAEHRLREVFPGAEEVTG